MTMTCGGKWLTFCAALALGEACGFAAVRFAAFWPLAALAAPPVALAGYGLRLRGWGLATVALGGFALALASGGARAETLAEATTRSSGAPFQRTLRVEEDARVAPARTGEGVRWASFPSSDGSLRLRVVIPLVQGAAMPRAGETWACAGWLERLAADDPSKRRALWVKGGGTFARKIAEADPSAFSERLRRLRADLSRRMGLGLAGDRTAANLNRAILLGERSRLPQAERDAFVCAGTIHVFAISGLHVMLVAQTLALILGVLGVPSRASGVILIPLLWLYVALTGCSPSAVRAAAMASLHCLAPLAWRRPDGLVAWSLTFLAVYGTDPMKFHDIGCALSFTVMLGLILWARFVRDFITNRLAAALVIAAAAWAVGTPLAAHAFGRVTPGGLVANLLLIPAAGLSVKAALTGVLASYFSERIASYVNNFAALVTDAMSGLSHVVAALPGANFDVAPWSTAACIGWYAALGTLLVALRHVLARRRARF